jgi:chemotaxis protein methyltransferase CheR
MIGIDEAEFRQIADFIHDNYGIKLGKEKKQLVLGRLHSVLTQKKINSFAEYFRQVVADKTGNEVITLLDRITTNHTFFMRENQHFEYFRDKVLPYLAMAANDRDLRIWSAGCASGQEAYTLAMILADAFGSKTGWNRAVLATDISSNALNKAVCGTYLESEMAGLPAVWRRDYFQKANDTKWSVRDGLKKEVIFRRFNLMEPVFPFRKKFHVIFCRNVMIYFDEPTKRRLIGKFYNMTVPGGYLFIGHAESLCREECGYRYIAPGIYRKPGAGAEQR